jgi:hypothetical protein
VRFAIVSTLRATTLADLLITPSSASPEALSSLVSSLERVPEPLTTGA